MVIFIENLSFLLLIKYIFWDSSSGVECVCVCLCVWEGEGKGGEGGCKTTCLQPMAVISCDLD